MIVAMTRAAPATQGNNRCSEQNKASQNSLGGAKREEEIPKGVPRFSQQQQAKEDVESSEEDGAKQEIQFLAFSRHEFASRPKGAYCLNPVYVPMSPASPLVSLNSQQNFLPSSLNSSVTFAV